MKFSPDPRRLTDNALVILIRTTSGWNTLPAAAITDWHPVVNGGRVLRPEDE
jgi:hypothetical protein